MTDLLNLPFWAFVGVLAGIYTIFSLGLQLQYGFAGLANFGHVGSMTVSAYAMAILILDLRVPLLVAITLAIASAIAFSVLIGLPSLRLRGDFFAITTLAFAEIVRYVPDNEARLGGSSGSIGLLGPSQAAYYNDSADTLLNVLRGWLADVVGSDSATRDVAMFVVVWAVALAVFISLRILVRRPWGRVLRAIREDEDAAMALGKNAFVYKLQALAIGSAVAAIGGILYAIQYSFFSPTDFQPLTTFFAWLIIIIGGIGRLGGVVIGAILLSILFAGTRFLDFPPLTLLDPAQRAYLRLMVIGIAILALMAFRPQGIFGSRREMNLE